MGLALLLFLISRNFKDGTFVLMNSSMKDRRGECRQIIQKCKKKVKIFENFLLPSTLCNRLLEKLADADASCIPLGGRNRLPEAA
jgi:hypothetical protein